MKYYVANKETGSFITEVNSVSDGIIQIAIYEAEDKEEGTYTEGFYDVVDDNHNTVL